MPFVKIDLFEGRSEEQKNLNLLAKLLKLYHVLQKLPRKLSMFSLTICQKGLTTHMVK